MNRRADAFTRLPDRAPEVYARPRPKPGVMVVLMLAFLTITVGARIESWPLVWTGLLTAVPVLAFELMTLGERE